jgi:hypothetical protein
MVVFLVYNNRDLEEEKKGLHKEKRQSKIMATVTGEALKGSRTSSPK